MLNRSVIIGRLTADPELRYTNSGKAVANFTIAVNRAFSKENEADFINCVVWQKPAENLATYQKKGNLIGVDGRIQTRSFENQEGKKVFVTEVVAENIQFLESKPKAEKAKEESKEENKFEDAGEQVDDSDLPF